MAGESGKAEIDATTRKIIRLDRLVRIGSFCSSKEGGSRKAAAKGRWIN